MVWVCRERSQHLKATPACWRRGRRSLYYGRILPPRMFFDSTWPCESRTDMFCATGRPLYYMVLVVITLPSLV
jgi:hypothetical protein